MEKTASPAAIRVVRFDEIRNSLNDSFTLPQTTSQESESSMGARRLVKPRPVLDHLHLCRRDGISLSGSSALVIQFETAQQLQF